MKSLFSLLVVLLSITFSFPVQAKDYALVFSPWGEPQTLKQDMSRALEFLVSLEPGDQALLIDGYKLRTLGAFKVPDDPRYGSPKALVNYNRANVAALMAFTQSVKTPGGEDAPSVPRAILLPQLLRHLSHHASSGIEVIVLGSALYDDPSEPAFSMTGGHFPGDGHLRVDRGASVFGAKGGDLSNLRVHLLHQDEALLPSSRHLHFVERWWSLYLQAQGGVLASFTSDAASVYARAAANAEPAQRFVPNKTDKLEMIYLAPVEIERSIFERPLSDVMPSANTIRRAERVELGLSWDCVSCDLDLYACPFPGAPALSYRLTQTPQGRYWKDYRASPEATNGKESIQFAVPIDLRALLVAINVYHGVPSVPVNAELRISIDGETYARTFVLDPSEGNRGADVKPRLEAGPGQSVYTIVRTAHELLER